MSTEPAATPDIDKEVADLEDMSAEDLAGHIRDLILDSRKARRNRKAKRAIQKGDLKALSSWERDITNNYGVTPRTKK